MKRIVRQFFRERTYTFIPGAVVFGIRLNGWDFLALAQADHSCSHAVHLTFPMRHWNLRNWRFGFRVCNLPTPDTRRTAQEVVRPNDNNDASAT